MTRRPSLDPALSDADLPRGFRFAATTCGLKKSGALDLALMVAEAPAAAAAVFTTNRLQAAPVRISREHVRRAGSRMRAVVVNSGNANCATGPAGLAASRRTAAAVARAIGCRPEQVMVCSTGVIGVPLRVERILSKLPELAAARAAGADAFKKTARAIMTTDTRPKWAAATCRVGGRRARIAGCAKGAGMIAPQMATMLAFLVTDAAIPAALLRRALGEAVGRTFNCITVDGDTSTNDTVAILASGAAKAKIEIRKSKSAKRAAARDYRSFVRALEKVCRALALAIVADGEGAQRVVEIEVRGAGSARAAVQVARTIANSPLVKTALAGADPNWGRILAAAGRAGVPFDPARATVWLAGVRVFARGRPLNFSEQAVHKKLLAPLVGIRVDLGRGSKTARGGPPAAGRVWTCDFTAEYVRINADYRT